APGTAPSRRVAAAPIALALASGALIAVLVMRAVIRPLPQAPVLPSRFALEPPPAVNRLTASFVAEIRCTNRLSEHAHGLGEPSVRRRVAAAGSDADAVVKMILNDRLAGYRPLKRGTLVDRASMRGYCAAKDNGVLAKRQAGSVDDVITAWRVP